MQLKGGGFLQRHGQGEKHSIWEHTLNSTSFSTHTELLKVAQVSDTLSHRFLHPLILHTPFTCPAPKKFSLDFYETFLEPSRILDAPIEGSHCGLPLHPVFTLLRYFSCFLVNVYLPAHHSPCSIVRHRLCCMHHCMHSTWKAHSTYRFYKLYLILKTYYTPKIY